MKVSGSHIETIESMSQNLFRISEEQTIKFVTEKLLKEGKHVVNIIHGTPSSLLGTVRKSLTFLWEADDEDPAYKTAYKAEKTKEERAQNIADRIQICKLEIAKITMEINRFDFIYKTSQIGDSPEETLKRIKSKQKKEDAIVPIIFSVFSIAFFILSALIKELFDGNNFFSFLMVLLGLFCLLALGVRFYELIAKHNNPQQQKEAEDRYYKELEGDVRRAQLDKSKLNNLKKQLDEKNKELAELKKEESLYKNI